ncbi:MAG TPA: response regulator, partial [Erythrobacter sp.]|nr:response regulator [Erythrobacter sp.]
AARVQPDLALLDISLPGMSGWEIAAQLRQRYGPALRIVMLSGEAEAHPATGEEQPANDMFVMKPFAFDVLLDVLGEQLEIEWLHTGGAGIAASRVRTMRLPPILTRRARPHFAAIERFVRIGHVRAIESEIDAIAALGQEAAPLADRMRSWLDSFDLAALSACAKGAQRDE